MLLRCATAAIAAALCPPSTRWSQVSESSSTGCAAGDGRHQVDLVALLQRLLQFRHAPVHHQQQRIWLQGHLQVLQEISDCAALRQADINPADRALGRLALEDGV